jgi:hypothetical protein
LLSLDSIEARCIVKLHEKMPTTIMNCTFDTPATLSPLLYSVTFSISTPQVPPAYLAYSYGTFFFDFSDLRVIGSPRILSEINSGSQRYSALLVHRQPIFLTSDVVTGYRSCLQHPLNPAFASQIPYRLSFPTST